MTASRTAKGVKAASFFLAGALVAAAAAWAMATVITPAEDPLEETRFTVVTVVPGEVGSTIQLNAAAEWTATPIGVNRAMGVVTSINVAPGDEISQGGTLYTVNLRPVVIASGSVPSFRDIGLGTHGDDVRQLQQMLTDLGFYRGAIAGEAGGVTEAAIRAWQKSMGVEQTGVVLSGDVVFVPTLPTRLIVEPEIVERGSTLSGGEPTIAALPDSPSFRVPVTDAQAAMMPSGTRVDITSPQGNTWTAYAAEQTRDDTTGTVNIALTAPAGGTICGDSCAEIPIAGEPSLLSARIVTVESVAGLVVPSSALVSSADGTLQLIDDEGTRITVTVLGSARGMSVVEGATEGMKVRVPGEATP